MKPALRSEQVEAIYTVKGENDRSIVRLITRAENCPSITWDERAPEPMHIRAVPAVIAPRGDSAQTDSKPATFDVLTCEAPWPTDAKRAMVGQKNVPAPRTDVQRIVLIGDTGCRMKASENTFQDCNDHARWPFAQVARNAAVLKPDLVIHVGDIHYRESPCPAKNPACAGSPWGYGFDAWKADLFEPAAPLLAAAPWVFVRGNHESCFRAGQGWFRFIDAAAFSAARSCDTTANDLNADFTEPYAVPLGRDDQLVVFDSSKSSGKTYSPDDPAYRIYARQIASVGELSKRANRSYFLSHHPLLAYAPQKGSQSSGKSAKPGGSLGLQSAFSAVFPLRFFPDSVDVVLHGHVHLFEAMSFASKHPVSLVLGNSGSANEGRAPAQAQDAASPYPGAIVEDYASNSEYGFALLERDNGVTTNGWTLTEYDVYGRTVLSCHILGTKSKCHPSK
jgi:Calcineurin-like phosphoesterase